MDKRLVVFAAGFLLAAVGALAIYYSFKGGAQKAVVVAATGDDDPIVVAGGSLEFGSRRGFKQDTYNYQAIHVDSKKRKLNQLEIMYENPPASVGMPTNPAYASMSVTGDVTISITYHDPTSVSPDDTVTLAFSTASGQQSLEIASAQHYSIAPLPNTTYLTLFHPMTAWKVTNIAISPPGSVTPDPGSQASPYPCSQGHCQIVPHYHCSNNSTNHDCS